MGNLDPYKVRNFNLREAFDKYTSKVRAKKKNEDYLTLQEFSGLNFEREGYPEIMH